jgi:predicted RNA binding protein YcfA (HicA-like mRNA interferase family)
VISGRECAHVLRKAGFRELPGRGKGSHLFLFRDDPQTALTVPDHRELKRGLLRAIIRQAGLTVDEFRALL